MLALWNDPTFQRGLTVLAVNVALIAGFYSLGKVFGALRRRNRQQSK